MKDFKDKFIAKLTSDYITPLEHQLGVRFEDYTNLAQGQLTIALVQNGLAGRGRPNPRAGGAARYQESKRAA